MLQRFKLITVVVFVMVLLLTYFLLKSDTRVVDNSNWSKQGEWILFSCAPRTGSQSSLYLVRPDGSDLTRLTTDDIVAISPAWSPAGDEIVFEVVPDRLSKLRRESEKLIDLNISNQDGRRGHFPAWSPDGEWIAFISWNPDEKYMLVRMGVDENIQVPIIGDVSEEPISWSPDGEWIAYSYNDDNTSGVRKVRMDGGEAQTITEWEITNPAWSPDGKLIAFRNRSDGDLYVMREDNSEITRITNFPTTIYHPAWSPDGEWIVFVSLFEKADTQLFKIRTDGSDLQQIIEMDCSAFSPDWIKMPEGE